MYIINIYSNEYKVRGNDTVALVLYDVLPDGNYDFDSIIKEFQQHKKELGIDISDSDIAEIVNVEGVLAMNRYMRFGMVEFYGVNHWYGKED